MQNYHVHQLDWTPEKVAHFWDYYGSVASQQQSYFGYHSGRQLLALLDSLLNLRGKLVLDFGCGNGYLLSYLAEKGIDCVGVEFSAKSVASAKKLTEGSEHVKSIVHASSLPVGEFKDQSFDVVLLTETIEHLLDSQIPETFAEIRRVLKPGGHIVVTTPNNEDLSLSMVHCSECGAVFHRWQHLRNFNSASLMGVMEQFDFQTQRCFATELVRPPSFPARMIEMLQKGYRRILKRSDAQQLEPNLIYLGKTSTT